MSSIILHNNNDFIVDYTKNLSLSASSHSVKKKQIVLFL